MNEQQTTPSASPTYMPNRGLNFLISLVPGAGQMYQGLMQRGVLLMALFAASIALTGVFSGLRLYGIRGILLGVSVTCIVITYFYSFFDSMRTCRLIRSGVFAPGQADALEQLVLPKFSFERRGRVIAGVILVAIGALGLIGFTVDRFIPREWVEAYLRPALNVLVPLVLLVVGVILLSKGKKQRKEAV